MRRILSLLKMEFSESEPRTKSVRTWQLVGLRQEKISDVRTKIVRSVSEIFASYGSSKCVYFEGFWCEVIDVLSF